MAVSVTPVYAGAVTSGRSEDVWGARRVGLYRITFDSSYVTNGEPWDPRASGFDKPVASVQPSVRYASASKDWNVQYDHVNAKLVAIVTSTGAEVANATDLSTLVIDVTVLSE